MYMYFNFPIVNFPFICNNIPAAPAYGVHVYISRLIRYSRACGSYQDFLDRGLVLTKKILNQEFLQVKWKSSLRKFTVATMTWLTGMDHFCKHFPVLSSFVTYQRVCNQINIMGATDGAGTTAYPSGAHEFTPGFQWGSCYSIFSFKCMFCRSLLVIFLLSIVLSVLLRFADYDYPFGIFKLFLNSFRHCSF